MRSFILSLVVLTTFLIMNSTIKAADFIKFGTEHDTDLWADALIFLNGIGHSQITSVDSDDANWNDGLDCG